MHFGIGPHEHTRNRLALVKKAKRHGLVFALFLSLPFVIYALFAFGLISGKPRFNQDLEMPVALVTTPTGTGTAFLVGESRLLTAQHVVSDLALGQSVSLTFDRAEPAISTQATLVWKGTAPAGADELVQYQHDFAVLELSTPSDLPDDFPRLWLGTSEAVLTKDEVILVGYPAGLASTTSGTVSNLDVKDVDIFQLNVDSWPGNSGGPLILESTEEVVGILVGGATGEYQGINFANKMDFVLQTLSQEGVSVEE